MTRSERRKRRRRREMEVDDDEVKQYHSGMYHRHFEGYKEYYDTNEKGKEKIKRVYVGNYYRADLSTTKKILLRLGYIALYAFSVFLYLNTALCGSEINLMWYSIIPQALLVPCYVWLGYSMIYYTFTFHDMTIGDFRTCSNGVRKSAFAAFVLYCLWALCVIVFMLSYPAFGFQGYYLLQVIFGGGACFAIAAIENRIPYVTIENTISSPGVEIH